MPIYEYRCPSCGQETAGFRHVEDRHDAPLCMCASKMELRISAPFVRVDIPAYISPVSERVVSSRVQRKEDLKAAGCIEWEPGLRQDQERNIKEKEAIEEKTLDQTIDAAIAELPARKKESLEGEMRGGLDAVFMRSTPNA